jgi:hypothetical protein
MKKNALLRWFNKIQQNEKLKTFPISKLIHNLADRLSLILFLRLLSSSWNMNIVKEVNFQIIRNSVVTFLIWNLSNSYLRNQPIEGYWSKIMSELKISIQNIWIVYLFEI